MIYILIILGIILLTPIILIIKNLAVCWWRAVVEEWIERLRDKIEDILQD